MSSASGLPPAPAANRASLAWRWTLWLVLLTLAYFGAFAVNPALFFAVGVNHYDAWFIDTFALLASNDAITRGLDPYAPNPLDYFGRPHVYSHWWLHLRDLGLTRADTRWLGFVLVGSFLCAAFWRLRPRSAGQLAWSLAVLCSSPILLAADRGNNDLVVFLLLVPLVPCLLSDRPLVRWLTPLLVVAAAMLKYYPAAAGLLLLAAPTVRERRLRVLVTVLLLVVAGCGMAADLAKFGPLAPRPAGILSFGSTGAFNELGWTGWAPKLLAAAVALATVAWAWFSRRLPDWAPGPGQRSDWLHFILGAVLLTGCFFTSMNFGYRYVFAIWLAPWLWAMPRDASAPAPWRRLARVTGWLLLVVLWWAPLCCLVLNRLVGHVPGSTVMHFASGFFLAEQPLDWALFLCLLVILTRFTRQALLAGRSATAGAVN